MANKHYATVHYKYDFSGIVKYIACCDCQTKGSTNSGISESVMFSVELINKLCGTSHIWTYSSKPFTAESWLEHKGQHGLKQIKSPA